MSCVNASYARRSARVPAGSPGKHRLRFLPSSGTTNGVRARKAGRFSTGTATTRPRSSRSSRLRAQRRTAAIDAYSQPCTPASTIRRGPSPAPVTSIDGHLQAGQRERVTARCRGHASDLLGWAFSWLRPSELVLFRDQALRRRRDPEQGRVGAAPAGQLQAGRQARGGHGKRHGRVAGEVVRAGEPALPVVVTGPERRVLFRRLVADGGTGQDVDAGQAGLDRGGEFGPAAERGGVAAVADRRAERQQGPRAVGVAAGVPVLRAPGAPPGPR